jgi:hypothetical protein
MEGQQQQLHSQHAGSEVLVQVVVRLGQQAGQKVEAHLQDETAADATSECIQLLLIALHCAHNTCSTIQHSIKARC